MLKNKKLLKSYKLFFALLGFAAIVTEMAVTIERGTFNPANFFSFFTIEVNILVFIVFLLSAVTEKSKQWLNTLRAIATVYILVVGIGFAWLLSGLEGVALTAVPWDNTVLHYIIPIAVIVDFIIDRPARKIGFKTGLLWMGYPIVYVIYSLIRGAITGWYPYPFLNLEANGFGSVVVAVLGLMVMGTLLIAVVTWMTRRAAR